MIIFTTIAIISLYHYVSNQQNLWCNVRKVLKDTVQHPTFLISRQVALQIWSKIAKMFCQSKTVCLRFWLIFSHYSNKSDFLEVWISNTDGYSCRNKRQPIKRYLPNFTITQLYFPLANSNIYIMGMPFDFGIQFKHRRIRREMSLNCSFEVISPNLDWLCLIFKCGKQGWHIGIGRYKISADKGHIGNPIYIGIGCSLATDTSISANMSSKDKE